MDKCAFKDCKKKAISLSNACWKHIQDKNTYRDTLAQHISKTNSIKDFHLRYADLSKFDFINVNCKNANFGFSNLANANFSGADMRSCNLFHANLRGSYLDNADLSGSHLLGCDLTAARLWHADLKGTNLAEADLSGADLLHANLSLVKFWNANIKGAKLLTKHNFLKSKGRVFSKYAIDEQGLVSAAEGYRNLKQYFMSTGRYDDASWASFKEKQLQRKRLLRDGNIAYIPSLIMALMCGYGEKPYRVILFSIAVIFLYAILYYTTGAIIIHAGMGAHGGFWNSLYFSIVTFTTLGFGDITPKLKPFFQMLTGTEAILGAFTMGLFVFTLARKYSAR